MIGKLNQPYLYSPGSHGITPETDEDGSGTAFHNTQDLFNSEQKVHGMLVADILKEAASGTGFKGREKAESTQKAEPVTGEQLIKSLNLAPNPEPAKEYSLPEKKESAESGSKKTKPEPDPTQVSERELMDRMIRAENSKKDAMDNMELVKGSLAPGEELENAVGEFLQVIEATGSGGAQNARIIYTSLRKTKDPAIRAEEMKQFMRHVKAENSARDALRNFKTVKDSLLPNETLAQATDEFLEALDMVGNNSTNARKEFAQIRSRIKDKIIKRQAEVKKTADGLKNDEDPCVITVDNKKKIVDVDGVKLGIKG